MWVLLKPNCTIKAGVTETNWPSGQTGMHAMKESGPGQRYQNRQYQIFRVMLGSQESQEQRRGLFSMSRAT